jgi:hypothetical protein
MQRARPSFQRHHGMRVFAMLVIAMLAISSVVAVLADTKTTKTTSSSKTTTTKAKAKAKVNANTNKTKKPTGATVGGENSFVNPAEALLPRMDNQDLARNDIFDILRNTMARSNNPAAVERVLELFAQIEDRLKREEGEADRLMATHRARFLPVAKKLNTSITERQNWLAKAEVHAKDLMTFISGKFDILARLPDRVGAAKARIEEARILVSQWVVRRRTQIARFHERLENNKQSLAGVDSAIDQFGGLNKDHFNHTLDQVLNTAKKTQTDSAAAAASLLEIAAKIPLDNLDDVRVLLRDIKKDLHIYQYQIITQESENERVFNATEQQLMFNFNNTKQDLINLQEVNATTLAQIAGARNDSVRLQAARVQKEQELAVFHQRLRKLNASFMEVGEDYVKQKQERLVQIAQVQRARNTLLVHVGKGFIPTSQMKPAVGAGIPKELHARVGLAEDGASNSTPNKVEPLAVTVPPLAPPLPKVMSTQNTLHVPETSTDNAENEA